MRLPLVALLLAVPLAAASSVPGQGPLSWKPQQVQGNAPFTVRLTPAAQPASDAFLKVCAAQNDTAVSCRLPQRMVLVEPGVFEARVEPFPPGQEVGLNATWAFAGKSHYWPDGNASVDRAYVFLTVQAAPTKAAPAPGPLALAVGAGVALLLLGRRNAQAP